MNQPPPDFDYAALPLPELLERLGTSEIGLSNAVAAQRHPRHVSSWRDAAWLRVLSLFFAQLKSPVTLILIGAAILSAFLGDKLDSVIILIIVVVSAALSFWQEFGAANALAELMKLVQARGVVLRDGSEMETAIADVVVGDVVVLSAGATIPGDCRLLSGKDLFVNEAALTGETFPAEKEPGESNSSAPLAKRTNVLFQGTNVISGAGRAVVARIGADTELGKIHGRLQTAPPETEFERGVRHFGNFLLELTLLLVLGILGVHLALKHPPLESFLFSLALAVGLTPQLLPAIISVNLAHGARRLAKSQVIVRRLSSIENFGGMDVLCSDKTGTLTIGEVRIKNAVDPFGADGPEALRAARLNAANESGFVNPIDQALRNFPGPELGAAEKLDEIPYDFIRKRLSVLLREGDARRLIVKGAFRNVLDVCTQAVSASGEVSALDKVRTQIEATYEELGAEGFRVLGVAWKNIGVDRVSRADEAELIFAGFLVCEDPPKPNIQAAVAELRELGVELKMITGDNRIVAASIAKHIGIDAHAILTGDDLRKLDEGALVQRVNAAAVFAEIEPNQKERIILALRKAGRVVGYIGDGINDAAALHAADVGISVNNAVEVAREAADIVLLQNDLHVLIDGVRAGRETFANTLKYIYLATSANFGNMFSMAGASLFLPFLPLLPKQVLLMNLLTDLPEMTIAGDRVDDELLTRPQRMNIRSIQRFMLVFGLCSSVFDYVTFLVLMGWLKAGQDEFRTGWFVESVVSAAMIVLVIRTRQFFWCSRPATPLMIATGVVVVTAIGLPYSPLAAPLGFIPLPATFIAAMLAIVAAYIAMTEILKRWFYRTVVS